jgi:hypothetical protein
MKSETQLIMSFERRSSEDKWMEMVKEAFEEVELSSIKIKDKEISILRLAKPKSQ